MAHEGQHKLSEEEIKRREALLTGMTNHVYEKGQEIKGEIDERKAAQAEALRRFNAVYQEIKLLLKREPKEEDAVLLAGKLGISPEQAVIGIRNWRAENLKR